MSKSIKTIYSIELDIDASPIETTKLIKDIDRFIFQRTKGQYANDVMLDVNISSSLKQRECNAEHR